jgi:hypothetical protein
MKIWCVLTFGARKASGGGISCIPTDIRYQSGEGHYPQSKANTAPVSLFGHKEREIFLKHGKKYTGLGMENQICTKFDQI